MNHDHNSGSDQGDEASSPHDRPGVSSRSARNSNLPRNARPDAQSGPQAHEPDLPGNEPIDGVDPHIAQQVALVLAQINQHQHIHLPEQAPNADQLAELKAKTPEVYELWIETTRSRNEHELWASRRAIRQPYLLASLGQWLGLVAVLAVLALAGYAVLMGSPILAGVLGVVDIIGLAAVFNGNQNKKNE